MAKQPPVAEAVTVEPPKRYEMPQPRSGMVRWKFGDGSGDNCTAIVTKVHRDMIDVMIFPSGISLPQPKTGVKYVKDPQLKTMSQPNPGGIWDFTDMEKMVRQQCLGLEDA